MRFTSTHSLNRPIHRRARRWAVWAACIFFVGCALGVRGPKSSFAAPPAQSGTVPAGPPQLYLPLMAHNLQSIGPPPDSTRVYDLIPVEGGSIGRPAEASGDINLALRGYIQTAEFSGLINVGGPTDSDAPQLAGIFNHQRMPTFSAVYQVHDWDWACDVDGCRGAPIALPAVTLAALAASPGEALFIPTRNAEVYGGGYRAMVLYAAANRLTLTYTRRDTAADGYVVHLEEIHVDSALLSRYREANAAGRQQLPALRNGEQLGTAAGAAVKVVIRDTGSFMDPRSRKDWWRGFLHRTAPIR